MQGDVLLPCCAALACLLQTRPFAAAVLGCIPDRSLDCIHDRSLDCTHDFSVGRAHHCSLDRTHARSLGCTPDRLLLLPSRSTPRLADCEAQLEALHLCFDLASPERLSEETRGVLLDLAEGPRGVPAAVLGTPVQVRWPLCCGGGGGITPL